MEGVAASAVRAVRPKSCEAELALRRRGLLASAGQSVKQQIRFVDDDPNVLDAVRRHLRKSRSEWEVGFHDSAQACLDALATPAASVIVTDWMMPGMDGMRLCRELRQREADDAGPYYVIVLTGKDDVDSLVEALDSGADDFLTKPFDRRELMARIRCGLRVLEAESALRIANRRLESMATTDGVTGLANRRLAEATLGRELERVARGLGSLTLMMLDVDHFKQVNDQHGHAAGDAVLRRVARKLESCCRSYDLAARWGGDEFILICPHVTEREAAIIAERVRAAIGDDPSLPATVSIGVAWAESGHTPSAEALLADADAMLYAAKSGGRNRFELQPDSTL
ncbi:MAG: diguanylate cyclase [Proteobacteria bacterium]|nr:diguanylate cyclase [Pseudomonadota bacterium]